MNNSHPPPSPEWLPFVNTTEEIIPGGAVLEPAGGYDAKGRIRVRKCTADDSYLVFFNGPMGVDAASGGDPDEDKPGGLCRAAWPVAAAAVHQDDLTGYAYPTNAGTKSGDWFLRLSRVGFKFVDPLADGTATVVPVPAASGPAVTNLLTNNAGGSQALTPTGEIRLMTTTGIRTDAVSGHAEFSLIAASPSQMGAVTTALQRFGGTKQLGSTYRWVVGGDTGTANPALAADGTGAQVANDRVTVHTGLASDAFTGVPTAGRGAILTTDSVGLGPYTTVPYFSSAGFNMFVGLQPQSTIYTLSDLGPFPGAFDGNKDLEEQVTGGANPNRPNNLMIKSRLGVTGDLLASYISAAHTLSEIGVVFPRVITGTAYYQASGAGYATPVVAGAFGVWVGVVSDPANGLQEAGLRFSMYNVGSTAGHTFDPLDLYIQPDNGSGTTGREPSAANEQFGERIRSRRNVVAHDCRRFGARRSVDGTVTDLGGIDRDFAFDEYPVVRAGLTVGYRTAVRDAGGNIVGYSAPVLLTTGSWAAACLPVDTGGYGGGEEEELFASAWPPPDIDPDPEAA